MTSKFNNIFGVAVLIDNPQQITVKVDLSRERPDCVVKESGECLKPVRVYKKVG